MKNFLLKIVSGTFGPKKISSFSKLFAFFIAFVIFFSSFPNTPLSPACGFSANTATFEAFVQE